MSIALDGFPFQHILNLWNGCKLEETGQWLTVYSSCNCVKVPQLYDATLFLPGLYNYSEECQLCHIA